MFKNLIKLFLLLIFSISQLTAQSNDKSKINAINNYVKFSNESVHGMLIITRLLENFNKKVNNYIETQEKEPGNYSNKDLPKDIFLDLDKWFYEVSPTQLYQKAIKQSSQLDPLDTKRLNEVILKTKRITSDLNQYRFKLEEYVNNMNYKDPVFLDKLYDMLSEASVYFDDFYEQQLLLETLINKMKLKLNYEQDDFQLAFDKYYGSLRNVLDDVRYKNKSNLLTHVKGYISNLSAFELIATENYYNNSRANRKLKFLKEKSTELQTSMENYLNNKPVPEDSKSYGKNYYYHNEDMLNKTNKYGNGLVSEMNLIIDQQHLNTIMYFEIPHFFKVVIKKISWRKRDYKKKKPRRSRRK